MEVKRMSKTRELFAVIMAFAMVFAGIAIIATEADAVDAPELNLQGSVPYYQDAGEGTLTNESLGDYSIEKVTTGDSVVYNVTGYAFAQSVTGEIDTVFESWWTTNTTYIYGIIFDDGNGNQFLLYMNDGKLKQPSKTIEFEGNTYNLNINLEKATLVNDENFATEVAKGGTFIIDEDVSEITLENTIILENETTILGSGQKITYGGTERVFNVRADVTISNVNIVGESAERGINVQAEGITVTLNDVDMVIDHYALNIPSEKNNVTFNVTGGTIQGYCAFQTWSDNTTATFTDSTLIGYNKWTSAGGWNDFATIVVNDEVIGANIVLKNCNVNEQSTQNDNVRAHELAVRVSSNATGSIAFTDGTVITPLDEEDVIRTNSDFKVTDDGTTDVVGLDSFNDCVVFTDAEEGDVIVAVITESGDVYYPNAQAALDDIVDLLEKYDDITIEAEGTLEIKHNIVINDGKTLTIIGATIIVPAPTTAGYVYEKYIHVDADGSLVLESADIRVPVIVEEGAYVSITKAKEMTVDGDATADLGVGYGNTLVLSNLTVPAGKYIEAYGNVVIGGNVTIQKGAQFKVHPGGNAQIDGALTIEGTAEIRGDTTVNGSVKVYNADGGAIFQTDNTVFNDGSNNGYTFEPTITVSGTMDVQKSKSREATVDNRLIANADVVVEGTLTVTGTFNGDIRDRGTVVFNGTAGDNASITIYDGVTITIASVTGGVLTIKDDIDVSEYTEEQLQSNRFSDENTVVLDEVKGITVSTELTDTVKTDDDGDKIRYHIMTMTVSGTFSAVDDKKVGTSSVTIVNEVDAVWPIDVDSKKIIVDDVTLGKNVIFVLAGYNIDVDGTVNVITEGSIIHTAKVVDVNGKIVVGEKASQFAGNNLSVESELLVNGAHYEVESADMTETTCYYTTLADALAASVEDSDERIEALGTIMVSTELEVPAGITLDTDTATITIDVDGKITVAVDALLDGGNGTIDVQGMLVIMDKESGLEAPKTFTYQVLNETETTATYSGLVLALQNAVAGDVITIKQDAVISKSVTIPEGVTLEVPKGTKLTIGDAVDKEKVTLTVAGTLKVTGGTVNAIIGDDVNNPITNVVIPGQVILNGDYMFIENSPYQSLFYVSDDYVIFSMRVDGKDVTVMSNLAYAAENATYGIVHVVGDVTGGDVTFTEDEKKSGSEDLVVLVLKAGNTLSVSSITLEGASLVVAYTTFTGTVKAAADGGVAEIEASKLAGKYIVSSEVHEDVDGKTDLMTMFGEPEDGKVVLSSGTITVGSLELVGYVQSAIGVTPNAPSSNHLILMNNGDGSESSISADATFIVPKGKQFLAEGDASEDYLLAIDGNVVVQTELIAAFCGSAINGTVSVENGAKAFMGVGTVVAGTVSVAEKTDDAAAGTMQVGLTFVGTEPSIGAAGTLVGPFETIDAYTGPLVPPSTPVTGVIVAYPGSDLSGALVNVNDAGESAAESTEFYINGQLYMTAITAIDMDVEVFTNNLGIEIPGLVTPKDATGTYDDITWYTDEAMKNKFTSGNIGSIERLYTTFEAAEVDLVVSAGVGLKVYIDGIEASSGKIDVGTHTVTIAVQAGYDGTDATITVNGQTVSNGGTFTAEVDEEVTIIASGAVPAQSGSTVVVESDDGMKLTDILLIVLVVLIVIMAIIVALRMMRS